ncbi:hypothetical protein L6164_026720 [Bauhinia variegata]|uniref:Uncharacterized protein n=1 Tax=Bauhinia variegata TaxID=167791 RepID=A0ACB9LQS9_BAUVA|nr:hypothetical protein L6164_026720 [Bauhinia variegata]
MLLNKQKKNQNAKGNRLLITINVLGSAGPIRFVVNENELVAAVIETALKSYAREGRLPVLGSDIGAFLLYCPHRATDALSPWESIGSQGGARNFMLCRKPQPMKVKEADEAAETLNRNKGSGSWKAWFNKSIKISSH